MHTAFDSARARFNMIEQQIRPWDVLDQDVLALLNVVKRDDFVAASQRELAFTDVELPIQLHDKSSGEKMWCPRMEARVLQDLGVKRHDRVLMIGVGSGYLAALFAHVADAVTAVEISPTIKALAEENLRRTHTVNVLVKQGDGARGFGSDTYDVIVLTGATPVLAQELKSQLKLGGRLFAVVGEAPAMRATVVTRQPVDGGFAFNETVLFETNIKPLANAPHAPRFTF